MIVSSGGSVLVPDSFISHGSTGVSARLIFTVPKEVAGR